MDGLGPFFLGGDGRSGTTLLSVMLDSHPSLVFIPELHFNGPQNLGRDTVDGRNDRFLTRCARAGFPHTAVLAGIHKMLERTGWTGDPFNERCDVIQQMAAAAVERDAKETWGLKIMKEIANPDRYRSLFPAARFICMVRDPRDVYASQKQWPTWGYTDATVAAQGFLRIINSFATWRDQGGANKGIFVKYEDLVDMPSAVMATLLKFLGLPWSERVLHHTHYAHALTSSHVSHYSKDQVRQTVNNSSIGRYAKELSEDEIRVFQGVCGREMSLWGYR